LPLDVPEIPDSRFRFKSEFFHFRLYLPGK
jgi:hypothetical protein